jgi:adenine-specific DNA-methyltransferase
MPTKEEAYSQIAALVERFTEQLPSYKKSDYNETLTRKDFIDPFFTALGWDMNNSQGNAEAYREVIHEDRVKIGSATKAPDYSFRLPGGKRLFFVEAKKPSVAVKDDVLPAYQVRRYAWSAKLPISILTDFEEFAVYDCKKKPNISDKASVSRIKYITYDNYLQEFDFIWDNFSKERVLKGGFDKYVLSDTNKKGTSTVDKEFLVSLDEWRKQLAQNIALRNSNLNEDEINFTVQQTLDRLIFLRIAEDRGVEEYGRLQTALRGGEYYHNLFTYFKNADSKYNSGLFDFKKDMLSAGLTIDNKVIKNILNELYYPISPYEFSVLSVEILGSAYEQFLGKQIRLTAGHKAVIEEKPEVRKAGGVYYTPQYIVDYIVENTVGKLTEKKTPDEIAKLKIVDPACGSGSFLIGAYQYLLTLHQQYYKPKFDELTKIAASNEHTTRQRTDAQKERNKLPLTPDGNLTTAAKKQILTNNIFGVDIDAQAVEVTKLSLMLKCMEGETKSSLAAQMQFGERVLPTLDNNIKSGNSLIDMDFYEGELDFEPGIEKKVKPFSWENAFSTIFKQGGFDCVIGNPPYVRIQSLNETSEDSVNYFKRKYETSKIGNYDLYVLFVERGFSILKGNGILGFILPNKFFNTDYGKGLRKLISENGSLNEIIDFEQYQVFENATTYCCLLFLENKNNKTFLYSKSLSNSIALKNLLKEELNSGLINGEVWNFYSSKDEKVLLKLFDKSSMLIDLPSDISRGSSTGNDKIFVFEVDNKGFLKNESNEYIELEEGILKIPIYATDFNRYSFKPKKNYRILFPYKIVENKATLIDEEALKTEYPKSYKYLLSKRKELEKRKQFNKWYSYSAARNLVLHSNADIIIPLLADKGLFTTLPGDKEKYTLMAGGGFSVSIKNKNINDKYVLGLLNSTLLFWYLQKLSNVFRGGWITCTKQYFSQLPIKIIDKENQSLHDSIVHLVETMLQLQKEKQQTNLPDKLNQLEARIKYTDEKINKLVFELYELSEEEVRIVEGN